MPKFTNRKQRNKSNDINTAALPDIIFMLLFFFMVVTVLKTEEYKLRLELPQAVSLDQLKHKSFENHIYVGQYSGSGGEAVVKIQFNDKFIGVDQIQKSIAVAVSQYEYADPVKVSFSLKVDRGIKMSLIDKLKNEIKKTDYRKVNYIALNE